MILKIPSWQNDGGHWYADDIEEIDGPHVVHQDGALRISATNDPIDLNGRIFILSSLDDKAIASIIYYRHRKQPDITHGVVFAEKAYLMNDNGKTIDTFYH